MTLRKDKDMSRTDLGRAVGITSPQIYKNETGQTRVGGSRLQMITHALAVPVSTLYGDDEGEGRTEALAFLFQSGADDLLRAYQAIDDVQIRRHVLEIVRTAACIRAEPAAARKPREP